MLLGGKIFRDLHSLILIDIILEGADHVIRVVLEVFCDEWIGRNSHRLDYLALVMLFLALVHVHVLWDLAVAKLLSRL